VRAGVLLPMPAAVLLSVRGCPRDWFEREAYDLYGSTFPVPEPAPLLCHDASSGTRPQGLRTPPALVLPRRIAHARVGEEYGEKAGHFETQTISIGPRTRNARDHPLVARLDGERIVRAETMIGHLPS
jgi:hypothetical protein